MNVEEMKAPDRVRYLINRAALELFPPCGYLRDLAADIGVDPATISVWMQRGDVPKPKALYMERRYGDELAPAALLSQELFEKNNEQTNNN